ncbi:MULTISPECIES: trp operon leader peptide [Citrobacter]|nr:MULTISPECIES: trp operon leader peptide [unclassified Citrobacter]HCJ6374454.1 trp operon leader peptide [Citrobacter freundii]MDA8497418.1 trp operon leader peptide [Citrobacter sp. Igbk 17]MDA8502965.1 trp operon leader peptide [Citrobacter sp. Awk 2]MDA8511715.1 trp operon leader peptide [Citrobacter sp. Igbk 14]MDA8518777.1 trp operon leader peptide [Citrobacter sp. Igbk 16]
MKARFVLHGWWRTS